jgi:hypothetical protein
MDTRITERAWSNTGGNTAWIDPSVATNGQLGDNGIDIHSWLPLAGFYDDMVWAGEKIFRPALFLQDRLVIKAVLASGRRPDPPS